MADTGWKSPATMANVDRDIKEFWNYVNNAKTQSDTYSIVEIGAETYSD